MSSRPRACDWDAPLIAGVGQAHAVLGPEEPPRPHAVGSLVIPDPEERRGLRVWYVYPDPPDPVPPRPMGFRRPR